jgi:drug/metabolite transporter (DMT)-like permease
LKTQHSSSSPTGPTILFVASVFFGSSALFIRFASEATAISLTFFRLLIAVVVIVLFAVSRHNLTSLGKRDLLLVLLSGSMLSLHFATFILAVKETTVANATFLVNTSPIMLAVLSPIAIRERTTSREIVAVVVATLGILIVANPGNGFRAFGIGDLSALLAAFFVAVYSLVGRHLRTRGVNTACYTSYVYATATAVSLVMVGFSPGQTFKPYDIQNILAILGLGIIPTALGHTLYNYALGSVKAVTANLFPLLEPIIASLFAIVLFAEIPTIVQVAGYTLILVAVVIVATSMSSFVRGAAN